MKRGESYSSVFARDEEWTFGRASGGAFAGLIVKETRASRNRASDRVSETLGKAAQGSASLGRVRLPNIQTQSNAVCRHYGAKIRAKPRKAYDFYRSYISAPRETDDGNLFGPLCRAKRTATRRGQGAKLLDGRAKRPTRFFQVWIGLVKFAKSLAIFSRIDVQRSNLSY